MSGRTAPDMAFFGLSNVPTDDHSYISVVELPVLGADGIASGVGSFDDSIDVLARIDDVEHKMHGMAPIVPIPAFCIQGLFDLCDSR